MDNCAADPPDDGRDDKELLAAHVAGDPFAFEVLVARHKDRLWAVALRTTGNPEDAADGLQEALLSAFRNAASFRGDAAVTTWLHRVVVNACLDRLRRRAVRPTVALPENDSAMGQGVLADPNDHLGTRELRIEIDRALDSLPPDQRAAVVLVYVEGYSIDDAAAILECPSGTVKSRCARGRAKLATRLAAVWNPEAGETVRYPSAEGGERTL